MALTRHVLSADFVFATPGKCDVGCLTLRTIEMLAEELGLMIQGDENLQSWLEDASEQSGRAAGAPAMARLFQNLTQILLSVLVVLFGNPFLRNQEDLASPPNQKEPNKREQDLASPP